MRVQAQPPWLPHDPDPPGRAAVVEHLGDLLAAPGTTVSLVAAPGTGGTTVAGAVAARAARRLPVRAARFAGCTDLPQLFHAAGWALAAPFPRDQAAVCEALAAAGPTLLILDDADVPGTEAAVERLAAVAPEARFLAVGRAPVFAERAVHLPAILPSGASDLATLPDPADPTAGNLVLRQLSEERPIDPADPWSVLDALPETADLLAALPAGIPGLPPRAIPQVLLLPGSPERCALRRCVAEALLARRQRDPADMAMALLPRCGHLLRIAEEPARAQVLDPADLAVVAYLARHHPDRSEAARARAAWSRLLVAAGQAGAARVWQSAAEHTSPGGRLESLLAWAEGDALLAEGELDAAFVAYEFAVAQLRRRGDARLLASVHLRCADLLQGRALTQAAEEHALAAEELYASLGDPVGQRLCQRAVASLRLGQGHAESAALALDPTPLEPGRDGVQPCTVQLTRVALALHRQDLAEADRRLSQARAASPTHPQVRGLLERLLGEVTLRRGDPENARVHLDRAVDWFEQAGDRAALGRTLRLLGDVEALAGRPASADERYQRATREQVRAGDMQGLARTLEHRVLLDRSQGSTDVAAELEELRGQVLGLSRGA